MRIRIWIALLAIYIIWGSTYLAIRFAIETIPPFLMGGIRFVLAGSVLYAFRRLLGDPAPTPIQWRSAAIIGLFLLVGGNGSVVWAEQRIASGLTAVLIATVPLWMVILDRIRPGGQRPHARALLGVVIGFAGIVLLIGMRDLREARGADPIGAVVIVLGALSWAMGSLYGRTARLPDSPLIGTGMEMLIGGAGLLALGTLVGQWGQFGMSTISAKSLLAMCYLVVFGAWIAFSAYLWLLRVAPTPVVSTYAYVNPVVAILLGSVLASEPLTPRTLIAVATILAAVILTTMARPASQDIKTSAAEPAGTIDR
jgi:drug/metabolite transporter (DMT)-like permease